MKRIYKKGKLMNTLFKKQTIDEKAVYRKFFYIEEHQTEDGAILFNTLTLEILIVTAEEFLMLENPDVKDKRIRFLIENYFLVPTDFDDKKFAKQMRNTAMMLEKINVKPDLGYIVILTTTGCNARCFYCFEKGAKVSTMTEQTARDVAEFIKRKGRKNGPITLQWFGGEPLINTKVIDIICDELSKSNTDFISTMTSNGYLFDDDTIKKACNLWKLQKIQITIDGTEEVYNRIKNYVYKNDISPFRKVLGNIERLLEHDVDVGIRLNLDEHNADDLFELCKILVERYNKFENCHIYPCPLFDCTSAEIRERKAEDRHKLIQKSIELQNFINENMPIPKIKELPNNLNMSSCIANSDEACMIVPDGHLGKCEHFVDSDFYGSIYDDNYDYAKIAKYKERAIVVPECEDCKYYVQCMHLACCTGAPSHCDEFDRLAYNNRLHTKIGYIYNAFKESEESGKRDGTIPEIL